jgi:hypothetical protein
MDLAFQNLQPMRNKELPGQNDHGKDNYSTAPWGCSESGDPPHTSRNLGNMEIVHSVDGDGSGTRLCESHLTGDGRCLP